MSLTWRNAGWHWWAILAVEVLALAVLLLPKCGEVETSGGCDLDVECVALG